MASSLGQFEKNVQASFGSVKKDMLKLHDIITDLQEKIQHLSLNHAALLGEIETIRERIEKMNTKTETKTEKKKTIKTKTSKKKR